jgi:hypothetical protein
MNKTLEHALIIFLKLIKDLTKDDVVKIANKNESQRLTKHSHYIGGVYFLRIKLIIK